MWYPSVEHAYQAAKTLDNSSRQIIQDLSSPGAAKKLGRTFKLRDDWDKIKLDIMYELVKEKFSIALNAPLKQALLATGDAELIEGNWWRDTYWGVCDGIGSNHLGKILMRVRDEIRLANEQA